MSQTKNVFSVNYKIRAMGCKIFSVVIFISNHFRRCAKRERGRERRTHRCTNRERERERSCRRTHDRAGQIAVLFIQAPLRSHTSTPAPTRSIHIQELRSLLHELRSTSMSSNPSSISSVPHDPPMPDLFLS